MKPPLAIYSRGAMFRRTFVLQNSFSLKKGEEISQLFHEKNQFVEEYLNSRDWDVVTKYWREVMTSPLSELPQFLQGDYSSTISINIDPRANALVQYSDTLFTENSSQQEVNIEMRRAFSNGFGVTNLEKLSQSFLRGESRSKYPKYHKAQCFAMRIGYDGTAYLGSQKNHPNRLTVELELGKILKKSIRAAGRTDKDVSAISQVIGFATTNMNRTAEYYLQLVQNSSASQEHRRLFAYDCFRVPSRFHPRTLALWRRYIYLIPLKSIIDSSTSIDYEIDLPKLNRLLSR